MNQSPGNWHGRERDMTNWALAAPPPTYGVELNSL